MDNPFIVEFDAMTSKQTCSSGSRRKRSAEPWWGIHIGGEEEEEAAPRGGVGGAGRTILLEVGEFSSVVINVQGKGGGQSPGESFKGSKF